MVHLQGFSNGPISIGSSFGGWLIRIFGSIFAFAGLGSIWVYFNRHNLDITGDPEVALILGIVFFIVGMAIVGGFKRQQIDRIRGEILTSWGILVPFSHKRYPLSVYNKVTLGQETRTTHTKNGSHTYTVYPLRLEGREVFNISEPQDFIVARADMERLAKYLRFPVEDSSNGTMQRRESHELDQTLAERRRKAG